MSARRPVAVVLEGAHVRLEPLALRHVADLVEVGLDPELWRWTMQHVTTPEQMRAYVEAALKAASAGEVAAFAIVERRGARAIGSTRYLNIAPADGRLEIGSTWLAPAWQRSAINTESKLLLLEHAFDELGYRRVEFKTDFLNERSRSALKGIGATEEGVLREHMVTATGRVRDTVYYSILAREWPAVRERLQARLRAHAQAQAGEGEPEAGDSPPQVNGADRQVRKGET